jgi:hypothetical protein
MTTPAPSLEDRVTILETRLDTILPTLVTKEDIARLEGKMEVMYERLEGKMEAMYERLEGKMEAMYERLEGKMEAMDERFEGKTVRLEGKIDALGNRLLIRFSAVAIAMTSIAVAAAKYL